MAWTRFHAAYLIKRPNLTQFWRAQLIVGTETRRTYGMKLILCLKLEPVTVYLYAFVLRFVNIKFELEPRRNRACGRARGPYKCV